METLSFYQIESPTTQQIFDAIINNEYTPLKKVAPKAKQIKVLLQDYFCSSEIFVTFDGVTNTGGIPYFLGNNFDLYELANEINEDWHELSDEEQTHEIELLSNYLRTYDELFNL